MELLYEQSPTLIGPWDATGGIAFMRSFATDLQNAYEFTNVVDNLTCASGDGTSSVVVQGSIQLYIDNATYIGMDFQRATTSSNRRLYPRIWTHNGAGDCIQNNYYDYSHTGNSYCGYAIWKTETNNIVISFAVGENSVNANALVSGFAYILGTATNAYTKETLPTILTTRYYYSTTYWPNGLVFLDSNQNLNYYLMSNTKLRYTSMIAMPTPSTDIAAMSPIVSYGSHWVMDNVLIATLRPTCFSNTYSNIIYKDHNYAQFGRYLILDENDSED